MSLRTRQVAIAAAFALPLIAGGFILGSRSAGSSARLFGQVFDFIGARYVDSLPAGDLYEKAARGLVREIQDPYAALYSPKEMSEFTASTGGRYGGLGMLVEDQQGQVVVSRVFPHTPAEAAGVREGDRIIMVGERSTRGWKLVQVTDSLKGTPGTSVKVTFGRPGVAQPIPMQFTRAVIHVPAVPFSMIVGGRTGYVPLLQFNETAAKELTDAVQQLTAAGAKSLVIDLRGNGGGIVDQAIEISELFLKDSLEILSVRGREGPPQRYYVDGAPMEPKIPIVVLTDGYTASASEIVAGALQDHDRALILGTTSFGKGLVQSVYPLDGGWYLKLTTAKWYTPSGRSIQKERKLVNGELVEETDSSATDTAKRPRPIFHSDAGRIVYGGGAISPDVVVKPDTLLGVEQRFLKTVTPKFQEFNVALFNFSWSKKDSVTPEFTVIPAWRSAFYSALGTAGVKVDRALYDSASTEVDRLLGDRIAQFAFGDSAAKRREIPDDAQLAAALELLRKANTQQDLFAAAGKLAPATASRP